VGLPYRKQGQKEQQEDYFFHRRGGSLFFVEKVTGKRSSQAKNTSHSLGVFSRTLFFENSLNQLSSFLVYRRETSFQLI
jgi:hypothetical protein